MKDWQRYRKKNKEPSLSLPIIRLEGLPRSMTSNFPQSSTLLSPVPGRPQSPSLNTAAAARLRIPNLNATAASQVWYAVERMNFLTNLLTCLTWQCTCTWAPPVCSPPRALPTPLKRGITCPRNSTLFPALLPPCPSSFPSLTFLPIHVSQSQRTLFIVFKYWRMSCFQPARYFLRKNTVQLSLARSASLPPPSSLSPSVRVSLSSNAASKPISPFTRDCEPKDQCKKNLQPKSF